MGRGGSRRREGNGLANTLDEVIRHDAIPTPDRLNPPRHHRERASDRIESRNTFVAN